MKEEFLKEDFYEVLEESKKEGFMPKFENFQEYISFATIPDEFSSYGDDYVGLIYLGEVTFQYKGEEKTIEFTEEEGFPGIWIGRDYYTEEDEEFSNVREVVENFFLHGPGFPWGEKYFTYMKNKRIKRNYKKYAGTIYDV